MSQLSFEENLLDMLVEQQLKLGYLSESVNLYYPLRSLNHFFESKRSADEMQEYMQLVANGFLAQFGCVSVSHRDDRFCIRIPKEGADYVHGLIEEAQDADGLHSAKIQFLAKLIELVRSHGTTLEDVHSLFFAYSDKVVIEKTDNGEFDELIYFADGQPDPYRYCLVDEMVHVTYHRYTAEDYEEFGF